MTEKRKPTLEPDQRVLIPEATQAGELSRRGFFRGVAALTLGGLGTKAGMAQTATADGAAQLDAQTQRAQRWAGNAPGDWVRPRPGIDHNVVVVGGGQSGIAIAHGLKRKGVGRVEVIDQAEPGRTGIWRTIARMHQLRTAKALIGPEQDNPTLGFRAWYETLNGPDAFDALDRIPRLAWADYVDWFQQVTGTIVRHRTRLVEIEPQGDLLRLHLESEGVRRVETTRKLVLANGYAGAGGPNVPGFLRALPADLWTHTAGAIPFDTLAGKIVGVVGAGSSAFDAAAVALESGAAEVHMFNRRAYVDYPGGSQPSGPSDRGHPNVRELACELPDAVRWRNFLRGDREVASVPADSIQRVMAFDNFRLHLESSLSDVAVADGRVIARVAGDSWRFDHLIAATGYRIDLAAQPELTSIHESIALWRDRYEPEPGEDNAAGGFHPYLGTGFQFLPREATGADHLRNIHCFNLAARLSFGLSVGDIPSTVALPRLVSAVARDLYLDGVDVAAHQRFIGSPVTPPDPAPYQRAVQGGRTRAAA
ncbi:MAG TPA: NAD(P)/FAD-dependent oxidoreductase [Gammaproteobacteria bacterium]|nr:NAD(P)/FAD-dependent oxidoreductase [Gammaproteobacteria bacterium]